MGKLKHSVLILGEGPTEFYYFSSLRDVVKGLTVKPDYPKHTSIKELEEKIESGIADGYDRIFCVIDMDTKAVGPERTLYLKLKKKIRQARQQAKERHLLRGGFLRDTSLHRAILPILFPIHGTWLQQPSGTVARLVPAMWL